MLGAVDPTRSVAALFPGVVAAWHPTKNGDLRPDLLGPKSDRFIWLRCDAAPDHEWYICTTHATRVDGRCPYCAGKRASSTSSLAALFPALSREWHPTANGEKTPDMVTPGSAFHATWRCLDFPQDHIWRSAVCNRTNRLSGCPFCRKDTGAPSEQLDRARPEIAAEWHGKKNRSLRPSSVTVRSVRVVWWRCPHGHEWRGSIVRRCRDSLGCPQCAHRIASPEFNLATQRPDIAGQWHPKKNGALRPEDVLPTSHRRVWWRCDAAPDHEWRAQIELRTRRGSRCPFCTGRRADATTSLAATRPDLAQQWHPTRNGDLRPEDVKAGSSVHVWWKCDAGPDHEWRAMPSHRSKAANATGCPACAGRQLSVTNALTTVAPRIARQWHPTRNRDITPRDIHAGSNAYAWWRCVLGYEWRAPICHRTSRGHGCAVCRELC